MRRIRIAELLGRQKIHNRTLDKNQSFQVINRFMELPVADLFATMHAAMPEGMYDLEQLKQILDAWLDKCDLPDYENVTVYHVVKELTYYNFTRRDMNHTEMVIYQYVFVLPLA